MTAEKQDVFAALDAQMEEIQQERAALDAREDALQQARASLEIAFSGVRDSAQALVQAGRAARSRTTRAGIQQKAAQHHLDAIDDYLQRHGASRQADVARELQLNSGTVSLALRQLEDDGLVRPQDQKDRGSIVWEPTKTRRTTVVTAGEGTRAGRLA